MIPISTFSISARETKDYKSKLHHLILDAPIPLLSKSFEYEDETYGNFSGKHLYIWRGTTFISRMTRFVGTVSTIGDQVKIKGFIVLSPIVFFVFILTSLAAISSIRSPFILLFLIPLSIVLISIHSSRSRVQ